MQKRITSLKTGQNAKTLQELLEEWHRYLRTHDRSPGTVRKYTQAVAGFPPGAAYNLQRSLLIKCL